MAFDPQAFIDRFEWTFAKTMPHWPHEYIVRDNVQDDAGFDALVRFIRENAETRRWRGKLYQYWFAPDGFYYWTLGWPVKDTWVINRAKHADCTAKPVNDGSVHLTGWSSEDGRRPPL